MLKSKNVARLKNKKIIAVIRAETVEEALKITDAVKKGGIDIIEITMTVPGALDVIKELNNTYKNNEILLGAGSVLDAETARNCILAGAEFIVCPILDENTIRLCNRYKKIVVPGAMTPTEVYKGLEAGADIIKIFPGSILTPKMIKSIKGPLPQAELIPTGGVSLDNINDWFDAGSIAVGIGSSLTSYAKTGDYNKITEKAKQFVNKIKEK